MLPNGSPQKTFRIKDKEQSFAQDVADDYDVAMGLLSESETTEEDVDDSDYQLNEVWSVFLYFY